MFYVGVAVELEVEAVEEEEVLLDLQEAELKSQNIGTEMSTWDPLCDA